MLTHLYLITREDGEKYVGVSKHPDIRLTDHYHGRGSKHLKKQPNLKMEIVMSGEESFIYEHEEFAIKFFKAKLNIAKGGFGGDNGIDKRGQLSTSAKLTESDVLELRELAAKGITDAELGLRFEISKANAGAIRRGKTWQNTAGPLTQSTYYKAPDVKVKVLELHASGMRTKIIAETMGIHRSTVHRYIRNI